MAVKMVTDLARTMAVKHCDHEQLCFLCLIFLLFKLGMKIITPS